jgi:hypothetical protein
LCRCQALLPTSPYTHEKSPLSSAWGCFAKPTTSTPWSQGGKTTVENGQVACFQAIDFATRVVFNGQPISEEEKKLVQHWIVEAANFHMLPKEEQDKVLMAAGTRQ